MTTTAPISTASFLAAAERHHQSFMDLLSGFVNIDSGSTNPDGVDELGRHVAGLLASRGWTVGFHELPPYGTDDDGAPKVAGHLLEARLAGSNPDGPTIMLMAHLDTVFEVGEAARRPFSIDGTTAHGPGCSDDKAGIASAIVAADVLAELGVDGYRELVILCTPDEELGSPASRETVEQLARDGVDVALCLEAARANGDIVQVRKGIADVVVSVTGRAAHAGIEPEKGIHAALQVARTVVDLQALNGRWDGVTVNCGVVEAGRRPNIVPEHGRIEVDLRAWTTDAFEEALAEVRRIATTPFVDGVEVDVTIAAQAPPMEATPVTDVLVEWTVGIAAELGFDLAAARTGGAADANTTASVGVPTLDGLAPIGGDDHSPSEWLDLTSVTPRVALLAALVARLATDGVPTA